MSRCDRVRRLASVLKLPADAPAEASERRESECRDNSFSILFSRAFVAQKHELKQHSASHGNVTFTCSYCSKVVKRKSGLMKHLRALHRDVEHLWHESGHGRSEAADFGDAAPGESTKAHLNGDAVNGEAKAKKGCAASKKKIKLGSLKKSFLKSAAKLSGDGYVNNNNNGRNGAKAAAEAANTPPTSPKKAASRGDEASAAKAAAGTSDEVNVNNIIDNCFFADDTLNCNVVLHSPFSSDTDVDGFILSNSNEGTTMNKELLNKFHDRLEEMEEKIENNEFKVFWNEMLDDENDVNDDNGHDELEDASNDANNAEFDELQPIKQQINEFA